MIDSGPFAHEARDPVRTARLPPVSVVVATHNRRQLAERSVAALLRDGATSEVVVVADGCRDGTGEALGRLARLDGRLRLLSVEHAGKVAACEAGLACVSGEVVLFVDDDVLARPGMVSGHARHHAVRDGVVVVGYMPVALASRPRVGDGATRIYAREYEAHCRNLEAHPDAVLVDLWGGNFSMRRSDCERVGFGSPSFPDLYHEDRELGLRCLEAGLSGVFDRALVADHLHTRTRAAFLADSRSQGAAQWLLHDLHPDLLGPYDPDRCTSGLPGVLRRVVRVCGRRGAARVAVAVLMAGAAAAETVRAFTLGTLAMRLARRVSQQEGARRAMARPASVARLARTDLGRGGPPDRAATGRFAES